MLIRAALRVINAFRRWQDRHWPIPISGTQRPPTWAYDIGHWEPIIPCETVKSEATGATGKFLNNHSTGIAR